MVVSSTLGVCFILLVLVLASRHFLLPGIIIIGSFILLVLWLTGLIETSLQLYGVVGNVNDNCQIYVVNNKAWGNNINTLAWLTQSTICEFCPMHDWWQVYWLSDFLGNCWKTAFALELVNTIFYLWMMVMSWQVNRDVYDWFAFMSCFFFCDTIFLHLIWRLIERYCICFFSPRVHVYDRLLVCLILLVYT